MANKCEDRLFVWNCVAAAGGTIGTLCFNEAHWLLAFFYFKMVKNMPRVILADDEDTPEEFPITYWTGVVCNAAFPLAFGIMFIILSYALCQGLSGQQLKKWSGSMSLASYTVLLVSAILLLWSVVKVK
jgi:hypothetical protein